MVGRIDVLGTDESWLASWPDGRRGGDAEGPHRCGQGGVRGVCEDRVVRGRKRHLVQVRVDFQPVPLGAGTLRRRRLRELRGGNDAPLPDNLFPDQDIG
jgi:hypothetical protein